MYQRNYKWNTSVAKKLVEDIISCYEQCKTNSNINKSVGLLTLYKNEQKDEYYVIDGQQRFTTLSILLSVLGCDKNIDISFERDDPQDPKRKKAILSGYENECTDVNRINRNKGAIQEVIQNKDEDENPKIADFVLNNVIMLCSVVNELPVEEFMNLNAYKTAFSISDHIRANLISLNSFYMDEMNNGEIAPTLARCLSKNTYKTAVAVLYNDIQEKLYGENTIDGVYKSIYDLLKKPSEEIIDPQMESRINIIFSGMLKEGAKNYDSGEITENLDYWIKMLQKLAYINKLLDELKCELEQGEFHSFKQIDDYQNLTKKSFVKEVFKGIGQLDNGWDSKTLAKEIQKYSNIDSVMIRCLSQESQKLANRYLEAFVFSTVNEATCKRADNENNKKVKLPQMSTEEVIQEISGCGRYIVNRYEREHREDLDTFITIPPVIDLEDRENVNFGGGLKDLSEDTDTITIGKLFEHDIYIPVIQRDYCMGARISGENDFLSFLVSGYNDNKKLTASTILIAVSKDDENIYIFDGQQRTYTLYNILKYCEGETGNNLLRKYSFVGRTKEDSGCGSPYSQQAVNNLNKRLSEMIGNKKIENKEKFAQYIKENISLKVKIVDSVSGAEQFFMDINGGVALQKYEIYKAILCSKLSSLGKDGIVRKIENKWLDFFYCFRKEYLKVTNIEMDESDTEELLEMRFIEFVCRFVFRMNHYGAKYEDIYVKNDAGKYVQSPDITYVKNDVGEYEKSPDITYELKNGSNEIELLSFDEIESKGEMVSKLSYIDELTDYDIKKIDEIVDKILVISCNPDSKNSMIKLDNLSMKTNSSGGKVNICRLITLGEKKDILDAKDYYIIRFIWSLVDRNREKLKNYYRYKDVSSLITIYDNDQIMRDIILKMLDEQLIQGDDYPYQRYYTEKNRNNIFYGGYRHSYDDTKDTFPVGKKEIEYNFVKEIPAYYSEDIEKTGGQIVRLQYLQEKADNLSAEEFSGYALVKNNAENQITLEDGGGSNICLVKNLDYYECTYRTEAYCLKHNNIKDYVISDS